jgi:methylglutaconyl-CoA hydratase
LHNAGSNCRIRQGAPMNASTANDVLSEKRGNVHWLTINRLERRNALNPGVMENLRQGILAASSDPDIRAIVITGVGNKAFCAGADLQTNAATFAFDYSDPRLPFACLTRTVFNTDLPIIARVNGHCMAGGMGLLGLCDLAVASETALFGLPEVKIGLFPMMILTTLKRIIPPRFMYELCMTGEPFTAQQARELGLVNHVVPQAELDEKVNWLLERIVDNSPLAIRRGKYAMHAVEDMTVEQTIAFTESQVGLAVLSDDFKEGIAAFNEKRPPVWPRRAAT